MKQCQCEKIDYTHSIATSVFMKNVCAISLNIF